MYVHGSLVRVDQRSTGKTLVMVMVINSAYTGPHLATSSVAPAPCSARARPCLDVWWSEPFLVQRDAHFAGPRASGTHGRYRAREITVWYYEATSGFGVGDVEGSGGFDSLG